MGFRIHERFESMGRTVVAMMPEIHDPLSYSLIGLAMAAHRELGPGLDEVLYHTLLSQKLTAAGIAHVSRPRGHLVHRGAVADEFEADLILEGRLCVELKVLWAGFAPEHLLQIICYLKFWRLETGVLLDFGKESLVQKRVPRIDRAAACDLAEVLSAGLAGEGDRALLDQLSESLRVLCAEYGLGYRDTTYRGLLLAELAHRKVPCVRDPVVGICHNGGMLGDSRLPCLVIPGSAALLVTALRETRQAADRAVLQTYLRHLELPWGLLVNFGKERLDCHHVRPGDRHRQ
jgi:GxxExxY protein